MEDLTKTRVFSSEDMRREMIRSNLKTVIDALNERGLLETRIQQYDYIARTYAVLHPSLRDVNEKRVRWIVRSMTLFQIALVMCALAFVISIILLLS